jgi:uncharacterized protein (DUF1501 family)
MEEMERAAPTSDVRTGWIGRMAGLTGSGTAFAATSVGPATQPGSMDSSYPVTAMQSLSSFTLDGVSNAADALAWGAALAAMQHGAPSTVSVPAAETLKALAVAATLTSGTYKPSNGASYPNTDLGGSLSNVAQLIKAGVGLRVAAVDSGNWDMHVGLGNAGGGWMHSNLLGVGQALAAFAADLGPSMSNVVLVTLSEFGRRVQENDSGGLDHGHGNVMYVLGGGINGGKVYGSWPGLSAGALAQGNLQGTTDYRTVIAEILEKRCGISTGSVFPGLSATRLGLAASR